MLANSVFVKMAVNKSWTTYIRTIINFSPIHAVGLLYFCALFVKIYSNYQQKALIDRLRAVLPCIVFCAWPLGFLLGLTLIGSLGSGYQSRFMLPALPGTAILTAISISRANILQNSDVATNSSNSTANRDSGNRYALAAILIALGAMHTLFYSVLYPTIFADLEYSVFDVIGTILNSPLRSFASQNAFDEMFLYLRHFGLNRKSS
jgi:hypothetical protein